MLSEPRNMAWPLLLPVFQFPDLFFATPPVFFIALIFLFLRLIKMFPCFLRFFFQKIYMYLGSIISLFFSFPKAPNSSSHCFPHPHFNEDMAFHSLQVSSLFNTSHLNYSYRHPPPKPAFQTFCGPVLGIPL